MMKISKKLDLNLSQYEMDFVDIDLDKDYPLFIDPFLISNLNNQWAIKANRTVKSFFDEFKQSIIDKNRENSEYLFSFMSEPKETCLGISKTGTTNGKGVGELNARQIIDKIISSNAIERKLVNNIEDLAIFVDDIDRDKLSDMVTNILRKELIDYTKGQCDYLQIQTHYCESLPYWDAVDRKWVYSDVQQLIIDSRPVLLVPKAIVSPMYQYSASKYNWYFVLEQERNFHLGRRSSLVKCKQLKNGDKKYYLPKKDVADNISNKIQNGEYINTKDFIRQYTARYPELFSDFIKSCRNKTHSFPNSTIANCVEEYDVDLVLDNLVCKLKAIPTGKDYATTFHHYVKSLLEMIFYPNLINPIIEKEIHDRRKRIDIVMDNNSHEGFFYNLHIITKIFCPYVYIECKNYGKDVANPEIDQLAGRFSTNRGQFGILICRDLQNPQLFINRCKDTYKDNRGLVIYLTDNDIISMLQSIKEDNYSNINTLLENKKKEIIIG